MALPQVGHEIGIAIMRLLTNCAHPPELDLIYPHVLNQRDQIDKCTGKFRLSLKLIEIALMSLLVSKDRFKSLFAEDENVPAKYKEIHRPLDIKVRTVI